MFRCTDVYDVIMHGCRETETRIIKSVFVSSGGDMAQGFK